MASGSWQKTIGILRQLTLIICNGIVLQVPNVSAITQEGAQNVQGAFLVVWHLAPVPYAERDNRQLLKNLRISKMNSNCRICYDRNMSIRIKYRIGIQYLYQFSFLANELGLTSRVITRDAGYHIEQ